MEKDKQCSYDVIYDSWCHTHKCQKKATVERGGKFYCKIHDPEYMKAKKEARTAKYDKEWADRKTYMELQNTAVRACKGINPDNPLAVAQSINGLYEACKDALIHLELLHRGSNSPKTPVQLKLEQALAKAEGK